MIVSRGERGGDGDGVDLRHEEEHGEVGKKCLVIYTGGTLGMLQREDGALVPQQGYLSQLLEKQYEFQQKEMPEIKVLEWNPLLDSSDIQPSDWILLAEQIRDNYLDFDGFVVIHGTDTMAYTASAISFMLENLSKCVIFTGSSIPISQVFNDAKRNLIASIILSVRVDIPEVALCFDGRLYRGNRCTKIDSWGPHAFISPNYPALGLLGVQIQLRHSSIRPHPRHKFKVQTRLFTEIFVLHLVPGFDDSILSLYAEATNKPLALLLLLYGTGNAPARKKEFLEALKRCKQNHVEIVVASQCRFGTVNLSTYATGKTLLDFGAINGFDMTIEACTTKLAYLMGLGYRGQQLKVLMEKNLRGEISENVESIPYNTSRL
jgi:L-asparaginase